MSHYLFSTIFLFLCWTAPDLLCAIHSNEKREIMDDIGRKMNLADVKIMDKILSEQDRIIWESMGLTPDVQSMENATLLTKVRHIRALRFR